MDFGPFRKNLRQLIDARGIMSKDLAYDLNMTPASISRYLTGARDPELAYVVKIAEYFDVSVDWILGIQTDKYSALPQDIKETISLLSLATPTDRQIINMVLNKYRGKEGDND